jgi:hypothetical protein
MKLPPVLPSSSKVRRRFAMVLKDFHKVANHWSDTARFWDKSSMVDLHKIPVSSTPNQLSKGKLFFSMNDYLLSPVVVTTNKYLHFLNNLREFLLISTEGWSKQ